MPSAVVSHRRLHLRGQVGQAAQQIFDLFLLKRGVLFQRRIEVVHVCRMMLRVVDLHRLGVDVRLQRSVGVAQLGQLERIWHASFLPLSSWDETLWWATSQLPR